MPEFECDQCEDNKDPTTSWRPAPLLRILCDTCNEGQLIVLAEIEKKRSFIEIQTEGSGSLKEVFHNKGKQQIKAELSHVERMKKRREKRLQAKRDRERRKMDE